LHGDDYIQQGFYNKIENKVSQYNDVSLFITRSFDIDENSEILDISKRIVPLEFPSLVANVQYYDNHIRTPSVVVRRSFYEKYGGFRTDLIHVTDWEMWLRCISFGGALFINKPLAYYRKFEGNDTSKLAKSANNIRDIMRLALLLDQQYDDFDIKKFSEFIIALSKYQENLFLDKGDIAASSASGEIFHKLIPSTSFYQKLLLILRSIKSIALQK